MNGSISYSYIALDSSGQKRKGEISAPSEVDAYRQLSASGLNPLKLRRARSRTGGRGKRIKSSDVSQFTYQLSVLLTARIPLGEGLKGIAEQESNPRFRQVISDLAQRIESGVPIAEAMKAHSSVFGQIYVETVHAAEKTGNLIKVLEYLSEVLERAEQSRGQLKGALMYPVCVSMILLVAVVGLLAGVVPKFATMYAARGVDLPILTEVCMFLGMSLRSYWWAYIGGTALSIFTLYKVWNSESGRIKIDSLLHHVPYVKKILIGAAVGRFARIFGLCLSSGLGLIDALELGGRAAARPLLERDTKTMVEQVKRGGRLSEVLGICTYLPPMAKRMLAAGEESAELPRMCEITATQFERSTSALTKNISTVIEPLMVVGIAGVVLTIAMAIFLPMWDMVTLIE